MAATWERRDSSGPAGAIVCVLFTRAACANNFPSCFLGQVLNDRVLRNSQDLCVNVGGLELAHVASVHGLVGRSEKHQLVYDNPRIHHCEAHPCRFVHAGSEALQGSAKRVSVRRRGPMGGSIHIRSCTGKGRDITKEDDLVDVFVRATMTRLGYGRAWVRHAVLQVSETWRPGQ